MTIATGASSRSTVKTPARTHAAPELRRSLHTRPDRAPAAHAIYQVTPAILAAAGDRTETGQSRRTTTGLGVSPPPDQDLHGLPDATRPSDDDTEPALTGPRAPRLHEARSRYGVSSGPASVIALTR